MRSIKNGWIVAGLLLWGAALGVGLASAAPVHLHPAGGVVRQNTPLTATLSGPALGLSNQALVFQAVVTPLTTTLPLTYTWEGTNQASVIHAQSLTLTDQVTFTWPAAGTQAVTLTVANTVTSVTVAQVITLTAQVYLPMVADNYRYIPPVFPPAAGSGWLAYVNYYRGLAGVPPVAEDAALSDGAGKHAHYMVINDTNATYESALKPGYTPEGAQAAPNCNLYASSAPTTTDEMALATWMQGPFHALGILDPALQTTGFGSDRDYAGYYKMAAALNVISGLDNTKIPAGVFPAMWPAQGMTTYLRTYTEGTDAPEPLTSCPGYPATTGLPIIVQMGPGDLTTVEVPTATLQLGGAPQELCWFTESTYQNFDPAQQVVGRAILGGRDAVVLIPKNPLVPGGVYTVSAAVNGQTYTWSFSVAN